MENPIDPLRAFRLLAPSDLGASAPELGRPIRTMPAPGDLVDGRYRLDELLAQGGMGGVYRAQDTELGRQVAVKVLLLEGVDSELRFRREAELTASLRHPHVLQVHATGTSAGWSYTVFELIEGALTLAEGLADLSLDARLDLLEQAISGVAAAHAAGIVHRDLKPTNVLIRRDGAAVVADFGVARVESSSLTLSGQVVGTPAYMPPEQTRGEAVSPASDVWSCGVLLYEALYGRHPFEDALDLPTLLRAVQQVQVRLEPGPPRALISLLRRVFVAKPSARIPDAAALLAALREARAAGVEPPAPKRLWPLGAVALALCGLATWAALSWATPAEPTKPLPPRSDLTPPLIDTPEPAPRLRWELPTSVVPHSATWIGDRLLVCGEEQTVLCERSGAVLASWPEPLYVLSGRSKVAHVHNTRRTFRLNAEGARTEVLPVRADAYDPASGRLAVVAEGTVEVYGPSGLLRRCEPPPGAELKQALLTPTHTLAAINDPEPHLVAYEGKAGPGVLLEGYASPGRLALSLHPDGTRLALSGQSGFVWVYPPDMRTPLLRLERDHPNADPLLSTTRLAHLGGVRGVLFVGERTLSWGRGTLESDLVVWSAQGDVEAVHSTLGVRALALHPGGTLAWVRDDHVVLAPVSDLFAD